MSCTDLDRPTEWRLSIFANRVLFCSRTKDVVVVVLAQVSLSTPNSDKFGTGRVRRVRYSTGLFGERVLLLVVGIVPLTTGARIESQLVQVPLPAFNSARFDAALCKVADAGVSVVKCWKELVAARDRRGETIIGCGRSWWFAVYINMYVYIRRRQAEAASPKRDKTKQRNS